MKNPELLHDLIIINNHRVDFYTKTAALTNDEELLQIFNSIDSQSQQILTELKQVAKFEVTEREMTGGKIYWTWMYNKAITNKDNQKNLLASCILGEHAVQNAYQALLDEEDLSQNIRSTIENQKKSLAEVLVRMENMYHSQAATNFENQDKKL